MFRDLLKVQDILLGWEIKIQNELKARMTAGRGYELTLGLEAGYEGGVVFGLTRV
jgi:hypothetical protein